MSANDKLAATFHGASLTDTLRPILEAYRAEVQPHWSPATAHPDFDGKQGGPAGQCGVTSAWLQRRLAEDHGVKTRYCAGPVHLGNALLDARHCWLEHDLPSGEWLIIDLTLDQWHLGLSESVVCDDPDQLVTQSWVYYARAARTIWPFQLSLDPVQARLAILTEAVGR